jgi:hypothetical protein
MSLWNLSKAEIKRRTCLRQMCWKRPNLWLLVSIPVPMTRPPEDQGRLMRMRLSFYTACKDGFMRKLRSDVDVVLRQLLSLTKSNATTLFYRADVH